LLGAFTKSAQFPFHFWLPHAMAAPTPVSAFLHSATMVKAGVFLLARLWPVLAGTDAWFWVVSTVGLATLIYGAWSAIFQQDLKGLLAYSTISHLGLITLLLGLDTPEAAIAAIFHVVNHATFKASLFMAAGVIDHETGTRDIRRLSGIARMMPATSALAMVATAAMAGVPLLNGFLSKEMFFAETVGSHNDTLFDHALPYFATLASIFSVTYSVRFIADVCFGPKATGLPREPHEPPRWMRFPIEILVLTCLLVGIIPTIAVQPMLNSAAGAVVGGKLPAYSLSGWHGFTVPLLMSFVAMVGGVLLYLALRPYLAKGVEGPPVLRLIKGKRVFERILVAVSWRAGTLERLLGTRRLQPQLHLVFFLTIVAASMPFWRVGLWRTPQLATRVDITFTGMWIVGAVCAISSAYVAKFHRFAALVLMSVAGVIVCATFVWLSAPDLALTQLLVEIVTSVLLLLGLRWLPAQFPHVPKAVAPSVQFHHMRDLALAMSAGAGMAVIAYVVMTRPLHNSVAHTFLEKSYSEGGGRNVVNVILVDFRGFDTMGEITVLGIVALTVYALLRRFRPAPDSLERRSKQLPKPRERRAVGTTERDALAELMYVPALLMHWIFPLIGVMGAYLFIRGHDRPGGGFAAGIAIAIAFILQYIATDTRWVESRLSIRPVQWMGLGLLCAILTGAAAWIFGNPFLTSHFQYVNVPLIGRVPIASALLFDLGVFLLVIGSTTLMLTALAHQSLRGSRRSATVARDEEGE
jgi:multicomponent K+:H+ antiporter subunit A